MLLAFCAAFALRRAAAHFYRRWFLQGIIWDAALHFAVIRTLRAHGSRYQGVPEFLMATEPDGYPILFHRFCALFSESFLRRHQWLPNALIHAISFALFVAYIQYVNQSFLHFAQWRFEPLAAGLYLFTIGNLVFSANSILYLGLSERQLAKLATAWYFLGLSIGLAFGDTASIAIAIAAGGIAGISSMFSRQAIAFTSPVLALLMLDPLPLLTLLGAAATALLLDRGYFIRSLRQMVSFSRAYIKYSKHSRWVKPSLSRFVSWRRVFGPGIGITQRVEELQSREPTRVLFMYPELVGVVLVILATHASWLYPCLWIIVATAVIYLATSTRWFNHFGEAARYIEYNLSLCTPFWLAVAFFRDGSTAVSAIVIALLAWTLLIWLGNYLLWTKNVLPETDSLSTFVARLDLGPQDTVYPIPFTLGGSVQIRAPASRSIMCQGSAISPELYAKFCDEPPFLKRDWQMLFEEFGITWVIGLTEAVDSMRERLGWEYDFSGLQKYAEDGKYVAYRVPPGTASAALRQSV